MSETPESTVTGHARWLAAVAIAAGLVAGAFTGTGAAFADDGSASPGGTDSPSAASARGEDPPASDEPSNLPPGIRISNRTLENLSRTSELHRLRLQMAMDRKSKLLSTLSNVLERSSDTAKNVVGNVK